MHPNRLITWHFLKAILSKRKPDSKSYMQNFLGNAISQILPALLTNLIGKKNVVDHVFQDVVTRASSIPIATTYNTTPPSDSVEQPSVSSSRSAKRELSTHHFYCFMFYV